jgi:beta-mannosidase
MLEWFRMPDGFANTLRLSQIQQGLAIQYAVEHWRIHRPRCMGALYWQLNDCWPVASWASIDYHGRWKSLHYFAKRFFAPFLITGVEDAQTRRVRVHAANDTADAAEVSAAWTVTDAAGRELGQGEFRSELPGCAAALLGEVDCSLWWESHGPRNLLVWLELWRDGELLSENPARFVKPKHLEIVPAKIEAALRPVAEGEWEVIVSADHAALWVHLELADCDFRASDNDFCLRPGLPRTLRLRPAVPLLESELRAQLRISSLRDTTA